MRTLSHRPSVRTRSSLLRRTFGAVIATAALTGMTWADDAKACGRAIELEVEPATVLLSQAEKLLDKGEYLAAARKADQSDDSADITWQQTWWRSRILATAAIRSDGAVVPRVLYGRENMKSPRHRLQNLKTAVSTLERMTAKEKYADDPVLLSALGEGLAQLPGKRAQALKVLTRLADDDLITSARTWGALAELRDANGKSGEARTARQQCEAMASSKDQCKFTLAQQGVM